MVVILFEFDGAFWSNYRAMAQVPCGHENWKIMKIFFAVSKKYYCCFVKAVNAWEFQEEKIGHRTVCKIIWEDSWVPHITRVVQCVGVHVEFSTLFPNQYLLCVMNHLKRERAFKEQRCLTMNEGNSMMVLEVCSSFRWLMMWHLVFPAYNSGLCCSTFVGDVYKNLVSWKFWKDINFVW